MDDYTAKSDIFFLTKRSETFHHIPAYQVREERMTGLFLKNIRLDGAGENRADILADLEKLGGIKI